jgi:hypothetical protein
MSKKKRASIFDLGEGEIDVSGFTAKPSASGGPPAEQVKQVSEAANFPSREAHQSKPASKPRREPRRYRTGRNVQLTLKAKQDPIDRFYAITDKQNWVLGYTFERAVEALERELKHK